MTVTDLKYLLSKMNGATKIFVLSEGQMKELTEKMVLNDFLLSNENGKLVQGDEILMIYT